jgi:cytosine/adenosine deaminase-related metal-dependent hydrolase
MKRRSAGFILLCLGLPHALGANQRSPQDTTELRQKIDALLAEWDAPGSPGHAAGRTPMEVLEASTQHAAAVCGQASTLGTLEVGKLADIIIVNGDPLADLAAMDSVIAVVKGGTLAYRAH